MKQLRFCVIGTGRAGMIHARNLFAKIPQARLAALCDPSEKALNLAGQELESAAIFQDYHKALQQSDIDAVVITTPTFLHRDISCLAASAGKHIFLEKPMAVTVDECTAINKAVAKSGIKLQIGFMRRFDEGFRQAKEMVASGEMGRIMTIKSTGRGPGGPGPWMYDLRKSNGIIAEVNSHDIDSILWLSGSSIRRVFAQGHNFKCPDATEKWPDFYDNVVAQFGLGEGAIGIVDGTCPAHYGYDARVEILCEKGAIFVGHYAQQGPTRVTVDGQVINQSVKSWRTLFKDAYLAEMQHFVDAVLNNTAPHVTGTDGLRAVEAVVAVNDSIRTGKTVELSRSTEV
jgi:predicted dehydrogenase